MVRSLHLRGVRYIRRNRADWEVLMSDDILARFGSTWAEIASPQQITVDTTGDTPSNDLQLVDTEQQLVLSVTAQQYSDLLSAALNGANRHFPENYLNVIYPLIKAGKMDVCEVVNSCVEYHGVRAARTADWTVTTSDLAIAMSTVSGGGLHDTDGYWSAGLPGVFTVPVGLAGYYAVRAWFAAEVSTVGLYARLHRFSPLITLDVTYALPTAYTNEPLSCVVYLGEGQGVSFTAQTVSGSRDLIVVDSLYSAWFGMHRLGNAP